MKKDQTENQKAWRKKNREKSNAYGNAWKKANPEKVLLTQNRLRADRREIINYAKDRPCMDCGIKYSPWIMQFDHRNPIDKKIEIGSHGQQRSKETLIIEIAKCDVVCANCHSERTHNQRLSKLINSGSFRTAEEKVQDSQLDLDFPMLGPQQ